MNREMETILLEQGRKAKQAARMLATAGTDTKNEALLKMAEQLEKQSEEIIAANKIDLEQGEKQGLTKALLDRLALNQTRIQDMAEGLR
ncbi:MAG TPA: gamma-glutamyl-phosphate reductase, partial [Syntrophomonas sp.]|nr:gamma-glutamyl-phosphate reductase [Syntrophomonas sp.]